MSLYSLLVAMVLFVLLVQCGNRFVHRMLCVSEQLMLSFQHQNCMSGLSGGSCELSS